MDKEPSRETSHFLHTAAHFGSILAAAETDAARLAAEQQHTVAQKRREARAHEDLARIARMNTMTETTHVEREN